MTNARLLAPLLLAGLAACSGDGGGSPTDGLASRINCAGLNGGTVTVSTVCTLGECDAEFEDAAADGDLDTYGLLSLAPNSSGEVSLRSTAKDGVTYPAGTPAAVVFGVERTAGNSFGTAQTISTYLDGVLQETRNTGDANGIGGGDVEAGRHAFQTQQPFDAIELTYSQSGSEADTQIQVYEFCTSTN